MSIFSAIKAGAKSRIAYSQRLHQEKVDAENLKHWRGQERKRKKYLKKYRAYRKHGGGKRMTSIDSLIFDITSGRKKRKTRTRKRTTTRKRARCKSKRY